MSTEHAAKRIRVGDNREVGGEAGSSGGGVVLDDHIDLILSSESALFLAVAFYLPCRDAAALGCVDKERRQAYAAHRNDLLQPMMNARDQILSSESVLMSSDDSTLFLEVASHLPCQDVVALGSVDWERRHAYVDNRDYLRELMLEVLHRMCGSNICRLCNKTYAPASRRVCNCTDNLTVHPGDLSEINSFADWDPRYRDDYDELSTWEKICGLMNYIRDLVSNVRPHLKFADVVDPANMPEVIRNHPGERWNVGNEENAVLKLYPRRAALAFNLALTSLAASEMVNGDFYFCEEAFSGIGDICNPGSSFGIRISDIVCKMHPFSDEAFEEFLRDELLPSDLTRSVLRPMFERVVICAPFDEWLNADGDVVLPRGLEPFDVAAAKSAVNGVFEWLRERYGETSARGWMRKDIKWPDA